MARILVTGSSTGLGYATARDLATQGHDVVVHARNAAKVAAAPVGRAWLGAVIGDLSDRRDVDDIVEQAAPFGVFDSIIHNAGVLDSPEVVPVNVVAPYLLTALLPAPDRLVYLSSSMHRSGAADLSRFTQRTAGYSDTKLWVTALTLAMAGRWPDTASHAVDPGWVPTRMGGAGATDDLVAGHETQVWLATAEDLDPATGGYWHHRRTQDPHPAARDEAFQQALIALLEDETGVPLPR